MKRETAEHLCKKPLKYRVVEAVTPHHKRIEGLLEKATFTEAVIIRLDGKRKFKTDLENVFAK